MASSLGKEEINFAVSLIDLSRIFRSWVSLRIVRWLHIKKRSSQVR